MNDNDREKLFHFSQREATYAYLKVAKVNDSESEESITRLLNEKTVKRNAFKEFGGYKEDQIFQYTNLLVSQLGQITKAINQNFLVHQKFQMKFDKINKELEVLVNKMLHEDSQFHTKSEILKRLNSLTLLMDNTDYKSDDLEPIFSEIKEIINDPNSAIVTQIDQFTKKFKNYSLLNKIHTVATKTEAEFTFVKNEAIKKDIKNIQKNLGQLNDNLKNLKKELIKKLKILIKSLKEDILENDNYKKYLETLKNAKLVANSLVDCRIKRLQLYKESEQLELKVETIGYNTLRIHQTDIFEMETKLANLQKVMNMISDFYRDDLVTDQKTIVNVKKFYFNNSTRYPELQGKYDDLNFKFTTLSELSDIETSLDQHLGRIFAELQGGILPQNGADKCFSPLEISVYFYYMNLMQIVYNKGEFFKYFINHLPNNEQITVVKQIFNDFTDDLFIDEKMIDFYTGEFAENGIEQSIRNYELISNNEIEAFFDKLLPDYKKRNSFFRKVLHYAGVTGKTILRVLSKMSVNILCKILVGALLAVLAVTFAPVVLTLLIGSFLALLVELFAKWVWGKVSNSQAILYQLHQGVAWISSVFASNPPESLEFEEILDEKNKKEYELQLKSRTHSSKSDVPTDRSDYFRMKFEDILTLEGCTENNSMVLI
jgi:hypothetical protein